jgi:hypothetical protein
VRSLPQRSTEHLNHGGLDRAGRTRSATNKHGMGCHQSTASPSGPAMDEVFNISLDQQLRRTNLHIRSCWPAFPYIPSGDDISSMPVVSGLFRCSLRRYSARRLGLSFKAWQPCRTTFTPTEIDRTQSELCVHQSRSRSPRSGCRRRVAARSPNAKGMARARPARPLNSKTSSFFAASREHHKQTPGTTR